MSAGTIIGTGNTLTQSAWRALLCHEAERQAHLMSFLGEEEDSALVLINDLSKVRGDSIQIRFSPTDDTHDGFGEGETIRGRELSVSFNTDSLKIGWLAEAYAEQGPMSQQRVNFSIKQASFYKLRTWWSRRFEESILNQLGGYLPASTGLYKRCGLNAIPATDANHHVFATGSADETVGADSTAIMTLDLIDECVLKAQSKSELSYPIATCSDGYYHLVVHPYQWKQLRQNTTSGQWEDITRATLEGGADFRKSPFARGWLGVWNNTKIHVSDYVPNGVNSGTDAAEGNVRRAVFMGAKSGHMAFGEDFAGGDHLSWIEQVDDYVVYGILAGTVMGFKTTRFNNSSGTSENYGSMVISTYATS